MGKILGCKQNLKKWKTWSKIKNKNFGKLYTTNSQHGFQTLSLTIEQRQKLQKTQGSMERKILRKRLKDKIINKVIRNTTKSKVIGMTIKKLIQICRSNV